MVIVASYPKSGATWFKRLIHTTTVGEIYFSSNMESSIIYYDVNTNRSKVLNKIRRGDHFYFKTHYAFNRLNVPYFKEISKSIYIIRNPLDVLASKINHIDAAKGATKLNKKMLDDIVEKELSIANDEPSKDNNFAGGWNCNVKSWQSQNDIPTLLLKYEDILKSAYDVMQKVNHYLKLNLESNQIKNGIKHATFEVMQKQEEKEILLDIYGSAQINKRSKAFFHKGVRLVNKGQANNYINVLEPNVIEKAKKVYGEVMDQYY